MRKYHLSILAGVITAVGLLAFTPPKEKPGKWVNLFNGKDLNNFERRGGTAEYIIRDGAIVGTSKLNTPNTFLCTKKMYGDFELELELKVDSEMNSGIQIRSNSKADYKDGVVHGYQVEIDPSSRAWSGGVYDEQRRGWLYKPENNEPCRTAFKQNEWNKYRIYCKGDSIKTWINGTPCAELKDDMTAEGFIGLQVHSTSVERPMKVMWKNIRIRELK